MAAGLDEIDRRLLDELQHDADRTNAELAGLVGLSPTATLHRIRKLKESGVIRRIRADLDPALVGFPLKVYVTISLARHTPKFERTFYEALRAVPEVITADVIAGETDMVIVIAARDVPDLQRILLKLSLHGAQRITTFLHLEEIKPSAPLPVLRAPDET
ncbi:AsnC family transcriptional regulator [Actinocorallia herbida]|uniref:AsnC family transcriptional regulator n=1 Tax=Actinocorallia herbida TaxID=58109 RepID=A0A3N1CVK9_9ACTN|nr:Lrp/AsnC family transcriptional regulator [Actinocorallia herbida]ROO85274.1 AsnC family transcriptional regulator [Actinocorallia herbida]